MRSHQATSRRKHFSISIAAVVGLSLMWSSPNFSNCINCMAMPPQYQESCLRKCIGASSSEDPYDKAFQQSNETFSKILEDQILNCNDSLVKRMHKIATEQNKESPIQIDSKTVLINTSFDSEIFEKHFVVADRDEKLSLEETDTLGSRIMDNICNSEAELELTACGIKYAYSYHDNKGEELARIIGDPADCH